MESDEGSSRSIEEIAKDLQKETDPKRISELTEELHKTPEREEEKNQKGKGR